MSKVKCVWKALVFLERIDNEKNFVHLLAFFAAAKKNRGEKEKEEQQQRLGR